MSPNPWFEEMTAEKILQGKQDAIDRGGNPEVIERMHQKVVKAAGGMDALVKAWNLQLGLEVFRAAIKGQRVTPQTDPDFANELDRKRFRDLAARFPDLAQQIAEENKRNP